MRKTIFNAVLGMGISAAFIMSTGVQAQCCGGGTAKDTTPKTCPIKTDKDTTAKQCFTKIAKDKKAATCEERATMCKKKHADMDTNKDGKVSKEEYMDNKDKTFAARDANKDGFIVLEEYIVVPADMTTDKIKEEKKKIEDKNGKDATKKMDSNNDKQVTHVEYIVFFYTRLDDADTNKDGKVSKEEYKKDAEARFQKADKNNDGIIEEDEMIECWGIEPAKKK